MGCPLVLKGGRPRWGVLHFFACAAKQQLSMTAFVAPVLELRKGAWAGAARLRETLCGGAESLHDLEEQLRVGLECGERREGAHFVDVLHDEVEARALERLCAVALS
eukprot:Amastigsp_a359970_6.p3 type:complete len:107 gc:universal Amastigsp_a359970_6:770-450(-)